MKLEVNIDKWSVITLLGVVLLFGSVVGVVAYNSGGPPSAFGHSAEEIEGPFLDQSDCTWTEWFRQENGNSPQTAPVGSYIAGIDYNAETGGNDGLIRFYYCSS